MCLLVVRMSSETYYRNNEDGKGLFPWKENEYKTPGKTSLQMQVLEPRPGLSCAMA